MRRLIFLLLLFALPAQAAISIVHAYNSRAGLTGLTSTTSGDGFVWITQTTSIPSALSISGGDSFTKWGCLPTTVASINICVWYIKQETSGSHTAITCTGCTGANIYGGFEVSGQDTATFIDKVVPCYYATDICNPLDTGGSLVRRLTYNPGFDSEAVYYQGTCSASASTFTGTGATWTNTITSGNPGASTVSSGFGTLTGTVDTGCGDENAVLVGVLGSGASQQCSWDIGYYDAGTQASTGNPTIAAHLAHTGNVVITAGFVVSSASAVSVGNGTDTFTQGFVGTSSSDTGQVYIHYLLNNTLAGSQTITATITGAHTAAQIGYLELIPSAKCTPSFHLASSVGTGTGATANTPSITATAGDLEFVYTAPGSGNHAGSTNSPWNCNYLNSNAGTCQYITSQSNFGYILSASGSATANNTPLPTGAGSTWQAGEIALTLTPPAGGASPSGHAVIF